MEHITEPACTRCSVNGAPTLPHWPCSSTRGRAPGRSVAIPVPSVASRPRAEPQGRMEGIRVWHSFPSPGGPAWYHYPVPQTGKLKLAEGPPRSLPKTCWVSHVAEQEEVPGSCPERQARTERPSREVHPHRHSLREGPGGHGFRACTLGWDKPT